MKQFKIVPLSREYANKIKENNKDDFGHEVIEQLATGKGPCRVSLKPFNVGEDVRVLISHSPFAIDNAFNQPGPVFIHKNDVEAYSDIHRFPPEIKANKESFPLTLIGYTKEQMMVHTQSVGDDDVDLLIPKIFEERPDIEYLHARNAEASCFICKIERL
ncbi:MAG TPA: DUF1203 domain-containing protein [Chitinophagaceae bacterium]|nr:DUF1203 domain-containing protein [Chitinophagaceae bacterium]